MSIHMWFIIQTDEQIFIKQEIGEIKTHFWTKCALRHNRVNHWDIEAWSRYAPCEDNCILELKRRVVSHTLCSLNR